MIPRCILASPQEGAEAISVILRRESRLRFTGK